MNSNSSDIIPMSPVQERDMHIANYRISLPSPATFKASESQEVVLSDGSNVTNGHDTCKSSFDKDNSIDQTPLVLPDVPFNTPQDGCSDMTLAVREAEINDVLDKVSETVTTLFYDDQNRVCSNSQSTCEEKSLVSVEGGKGTTEAAEKKLKSIETDLVVPISTDKLDEMYCEEISQCETDLVVPISTDKLDETYCEEISQCETDLVVPISTDKLDETYCEEISQCETDLVVPISTDKLDEMYCEEISQCEKSMSQCSIFMECESGDECVNKCVLQESPPLCHQINFACKLNLMPTCLQTLSDCDESSKPCTLVDDKVEKMASPSGFGGNKSVLKYVLENTCSHVNSDDSQELEMDNYKLCRNREKKGEYEGNSVIYVSYDVPVNTSFTAGCGFAGKISHDDMIDGFDRHLKEDVKITLDSILEKCSKVCVMDYGNSHTSINQYEEQCASGRNILDLKTESENEVTVCTLLAESLRGDSCHTKPSTINEANTSHMKMIGEYAADCQVPVAMLFHDNNQQDNRRSHENLAALVMHSSGKSTNKTEKFIVDSPEPTDPSIKYTQNLSETENRVSLSPLRPTLEDSSCNEGENLENDNFGQNKKIHCGDIELTKLGLIRGNAQFDQGEMQVQEQSSSSCENVTDCPVGSALIAGGQVVHVPIPFEEEGLVAQSEDIYERENDLREAYSTFNNLQEDIESSAQNAEENHTGDEACSLKNIQSEMVRSHGTEENRFPSRNKTVVSPHILDNLSPLKNKSRGNNYLNRPTAETQTENGDSTYSVGERLCCSRPGFTEHVSSVTELGSSCLPGYHVTRGNTTCSAFSLPVNSRGASDPASEETEYLCTQQFTASVSQTRIAEYLRDTSEHYGSDPIDQMPVTEEEGISEQHILEVTDQTVPYNFQLSTYESDVVMYEENTLPIKEQECVPVPAPTLPCFKWKYAPSAYLDDTPPGPKDSKPCDEDTLLTIFPLRTCRRPIRVGLSKRFRTKSLHENLKP